MKNECKNEAKKQRKPILEMANRKKFSEKLAKQIAELVAEGNHTITEICQLTGISRRSYYKWLEENAQMHSLIKRAEKIISMKEADVMVSESKNSLLKLLRGFEITTVKQTTRHLPDGSTRVILEYTTKHVAADTNIIKFVLLAKDSKNFKARVSRLVNIRYKAIHKEAQKEGRILSDNEPRPESFASLIAPLTKLQAKSNE